MLSIHKNDIRQVVKISIGQAARELGVSKETLRRWEKSEKIIVERTPKGHRRYDISKLNGRPSSLANSLQKKKTIVYARVSGHDQKADLIRQVSLLESFCASRGWQYEILQDLGSGLNYGKKD